ncbi:MAG: PaaI family thioesterase [Alphaproteobacteria bacterium]|nr:PaaI family thioesterase [Alphaproteobacteria bacterium]
MVATTRLTREAFDALVAAELPVAIQMGFRIETLDHGHVVARAVCQEGFLRPGGTIAGPVMMALADYTMYAVTMSLIGPVALAVTTNLNINFLRKPAPRDLLAEGRILKLGKRLAVSEVILRSDGEREPVAHVTGTYSIPPREGETG